MKTSTRLATLCQQGMVESMSVDIMVTIIGKIIHNYDLYQRTGFPSSIPIPKRDASSQIISDIKSGGLLIELATLLVKIHLEGHMGREYPISNIRQIIREMFELGYLFDEEYKLFVENSAMQRTPNWGVLRSGIEYPFTFLRLDIAGNSVLVRENNTKEVEAAYDDVRVIIEHAVQKRNGRIWSWEGDGVLASFYFSKKNENATLAGMEIIHEIFVYNHLRCTLKNPINVRIAVHAGMCTFTDNMEEIKKSETIKRVIDIESKTALNSMTLSGTTAQHFNDILLNQFEASEKVGSFRNLNYSLRWENR
jgi:hypothetical protein